MARTKQTQRRLTPPPSKAEEALKRELIFNNSLKLMEHLKNELEITLDKCNLVSCSFRSNENDFDENFKDENDTTLLMHAAIRHPNMVVELIQGSNIALKDKAGYTALMYAAENGHSNVVRMLTSSTAIYPPQTLAKIKASIDTRNNKHQTALMLASKKGYIEIVERLLNAANMNVKSDTEIKDKEGNTALLIAAKHDHYRLMQRLIDSGANINAVNNNYESALIISTKRNCPDSIYTLINAGVDLNLYDEEGNTALLYALKYGSLETVQLFMNINVDIDIHDKEGNTALMIAVLSGKFELVQAILAKSPDLERKNIEGDTALLLATERGYEDIAQMLIDAGASFYVENNEKKTVLEIATKHQYTNIISMLVIKYASNERNEEIAVFNAVKKGDIDEVLELLPNKTDTDTNPGINIEIKNSSDFTILMAASMCGHLDIVKLFLERGADVNTQDKSGYTALIYAIKSNRSDVVQLLINNGGNLNLADTNGITTLIHAFNTGNMDIVQLLINSGTMIPLYLNAKDDDIIKNSMTLNILVKLIDNAICSHPFIVKTVLKNGQKFDDEFFQAFQERNILSDALYEKKLKYLNLLQNIVILTKDDIDAQDVKGKTALMLAAETGYLSLIELLIKSGADFEVRDNKDGTALIYALSVRDLDVIQLLLDNNAKYTLNSEGFRNKYAGLGDQGYRDIILDAIHTHPNIIKKLIEAGLSEDFDNILSCSEMHDHLTFLQAVIRSGHLELVKIILDMNDSDNTEQYSGRRIIYNRLSITERELVIAVKQGFIDILKLLIENSAKTCFTEEYGPISLIIAIYFDAADNEYEGTDNIAEFAVEISYDTRLEIVEILINAGADINAKSIDWVENAPMDISTDTTILMAAAKKGYVEIVKMLLDAGADVNLKNEYFNEYCNEVKETALTYAFKANKNNVEIIEMLLKAGADIDASGIDDFAEKYKAIAVNKNIGFDNYYCHIDSLGNCNVLSKEIKKQMISFFTQAIDDFNLECATIFNKMFGIASCPIAQLIELRQEGVGWQETVKDLEENDNSSEKQRISTDSQKLINFYQQHYSFSYDLEKFFKSDILDEQQADILKREITLANIQILKENCQYLSDKNYIAEVETLNKLSLPDELKTLLQKLLIDYVAYQDLTAENANDNFEENHDRQSEHTNEKAVEILGINDMEINNAE